MLPKFIYYRMQIIEYDHSTHKRYWIQQYSKIEVDVPPIDEQRRIVSRIEELFSELDNSVSTLQKTMASDVKMDVLLMSIRKRCSRRSAPTSAMSLTS